MTPQQQAAVLQDQAARLIASGDYAGGFQLQAQAAALMADSGIPTWVWIAGLLGLGWFLSKGR